MSETRTSPALPYFIGCPMWSHKHWFKNWMPSQARGIELAFYSQWFNSVEGNTSFYHLPSHDALSNWQQQAASGFTFTFKFPQTISHADNLLHQTAELEAMFARFAPLRQSIGCLMLQLPARFGPERLGELETFLQSLPREYEYALEVRHLRFFAKGEEERKLNQLLMRLAINRVIMDTRGLFAAPPQNTLVADVQSKKPRVPTNVIATAKRPIVRFVGHPNLHENTPYLLPWVHKLANWLKQGLQPFVFFHMADNAEAPWLAALFFTLLAQHYPDIPRPVWQLPAYSAPQIDLF